jgi:hypothetical protein
MGTVYQQMIARSAESGKDWATRLDANLALARFATLLDGDEVPGIKAVVLGDSHVLLYSISTPWWGGPPWLAEQFYVRVAKGPTSYAMQAVEDLAKDNECKTIVFATSLAARDDGLSRLLRRYGYTQESTQHIKDL